MSDSITPNPPPAEQRLTPPAPAPAPAAPAVTPAAPKPAPKAPAKGKGADRRGFLGMLGSWFAFAWVTFTATMGLMTLGTLRFLFPNVLAEPPSKVKVGLPESFEEGKVVERFKDQNLWV